MTVAIATPRRALRFGTFELDVASRELRHHGLRVTLADQPFDILTALLEHPGEIVTREALRQRIWAADTFVDFEHGLNAAVHRLREALGDSADVPRYVETVPRRGYRFIAPVFAGDVAVATAEPAARAGALDERGVSQSRLMPVSTRGRLTVFGGSVVLAGLIAFGVVYLAYGRGGTTVPSRSDLTPEALAPSVMPLTSMSGTEMFPTFSPDANQVAFAWDGEKSDNWDIYLKMVGASAMRRVTADPQPETAPSWSPDGLRIAFLCGAGKSSAVYPYGFMNVCLVSPLGGPVRRLSEFPVYTLPPSWSRDGRWLAVTRAFSPAQPELAGVYLLPVDGGEPRHLALPKAPEGICCPSISPDGRHLAYAPRQGVLTFTVDVIGLTDGTIPDGPPAG